MGSEIPQRPHREKAVFQVTQLWFDISHGASWGQLLEQPAVLREAHGGLPLSVKFRIAAASA